MTAHELFFLWQMELPLVWLMLLPLWPDDIALYMYRLE